MNKKIAKPLIIQITAPETDPTMKRSQKALFVPANVPWAKFKDNVIPLVNDSAYDSVLVHVKDDVDRDMKGVVGNISVKMNALSGAGTRANKPVLTYESANEPFYLMNPTKDEMKNAGYYAPSDDMIMEKYNGFGSDAKWQEHQDKVWSRMKDMMPLSARTDKFNRNHAAQLKDPKRGFEDKDLDKFWSFKPRQSLAPTIMGDDMVGMPSVEGREYEGFTMANNQPDGSVKINPMIVRSLMTTGASGIMIPMANADGNVNKHQIAADMTAWGTVLHFRAEDGHTVEKKQLYDKKTREYKFTFADGNETHLKVTDVSPDNTITMQDTKGIFNIQPKREIIDTLKERGYEIPDIIKSAKAEQKGKYMWQSPGTMTGSDSILKTVSPSNPGYIVARPPKGNVDEYVVLVAEGALKGHIVAKYVDVKDKDGACFGDKIAGNRGLIVTQVPGVSEAYIKNSLTIYEKYDIKGTYIAMDADGRENRNVALGIHNAYNYINEISPATVLSWDPEQKGMDDALLAVAQGKITIKEMGLVTGSPEILFPMEKARPMTPYKLDGTQRTQPSWQEEYEDDKKARKTKVKAAQEATANRDANRKNTPPVSEQSAKETKWVKTPEDISNLQHVTEAKAAEIADAMNGKLPESKQDTKTAPTLDIDEQGIEDDMNLLPEQDIEKIDRGMENARKWDRENAAMEPVKTPDNYKSVYRYQQPVIVPSKVSTDNISEKTEYLAHDGWGIITVNTEHIMTPQEKEDHQTALRNDGLTIVGNMRLVEQTVTLNKEMVLEKTNDNPLEP